MGIDQGAAGAAAKPRTLAEKVWDDHVVVSGGASEPDLIYIDLHLVHEVTSPQAFDGLRLAGRPVRRPDLTLATEDHNVPTVDIDKPIADPVSRTQVETLRRNCAEFGVRLYPMGDVEQGIVHVVGPQLGLTQPGMTVVCGDSHTSTHGAFGALAMGIGTSEVEHVLATQTRDVPSRRYNCTLSPVVSRSCGSTAALAASSGSLTWAASSLTAGPSRHRPSSSRPSSRCTSSAAASRYVVALGIPVRSHSSASPHGDSPTACSMPTALSRTPIPLCCLMRRY